MNYYDCRKYYNSNKQKIVDINGFFYYNNTLYYKYENHIVNCLTDTEVSIPTDTFVSVPKVEVIIKD